jgi:hypothetical protein
MHRRISFILFLSIVLLWSCGPKEGKIVQESAENTVLIEVNKLLTDAQVERHFTPPVAARNYAYPNVAGYMALQPFFSEQYNSLAGLARDCTIDPKPDSTKEYNLELVYLSAFTNVAYELIYRDTILGDYRSKYEKKYESELSPDVYERSVAYGKQVAQDVLDWASTDKYRETRNMMQFSPGKEIKEWRPTAPDYMAAIEPNWNLIRPFFLDSAAQFKPPRPTTVDVNANSPFMKETEEVIQAVRDSTPERIAIAQFWDCNPNISHHQGHMMYFFQKISPGGHWVHIALQAVEFEKYNLMEASEKLATTTMALHDAFIACWDEKYRSNYVRPLTVINQTTDKKWRPILQTPAFPEYPSGHSVASAAAATVLTELVGEPFPFQDSTEVEYGLPIRTFSSFREASDEAAISRLYGGIHFMPAITEGVTMGNKVGELVLERAKLKRETNEK